jgi:hypothetical protein
MNPDFLDMLSALCDAGAEYLVVGAHAVAVHARPRATGDLDIWVRPTPDNAARVSRALEAFGAPLRDFRPGDLTSGDLVFQIGVPPGRIDLLTDLGSVEFEDAWKNRVTVVIGGVPVPVIGRAELIRAKLDAGGPRDLADVAELEERSGGDAGR